MFADYIKIHGLRDKWARPMTQRPVLEPAFVAAMHGVELTFLLLTNFLRDKRPYIALQHRIELVSKDVSQSHFSCIMLALLLLIHTRRNRHLCFSLAAESSRFNLRPSTQDSVSIR